MEKDFPLEEFYTDIHGTYDRVNRVFTFGRDRAWRKSAVDACLEKAPAEVLDVCTGTGDFILELAAEAREQGQQESMHFFGYDLTNSMLEEARKKLEFRKAGGSFPEVDFIQGDVRSMPFEDGHFDAMGITFGIRNLLYENSYAEQHLRELYRVLKSGGVFVILESSKPGSWLWRVFNNIYLRFILPLIGGLLSGNFKAYRYLAKSSRNYYTKEQMKEILEEAGFRFHLDRSLFLGSVMLVVVTK